MSRACRAALGREQPAAVARAPARGWRSRPRTAPRASASSSSPTRGPERDAELARPARRRAAAARGGPSARQRSASVSISRASAQVRVDRLLGALAARGQAVGDRQQRHVDLDRARRRAGSRYTVRRASGWGSWTRKPEPQVVAHERRDVGAQPLAGAQPREHRPGQLGPARVVADERHAPVRRAHLARRAAWRRRAAAPPSAAPRRASARRRAALPSSASSLRAMLAERAPALGRRGSPPRARQLDRPLEHLERVPVDVAVVEAALLDAAQRLELGQHHRGGAQLAHQLEAPRARAARRGSAAAPRRPARRRPRQAGAPARGRRAASRASGSQVELDRDPHEPQHPQRVVARTPAARPCAGAARRRSSSPPSGSIGAPPASGSAIALTVKSRSARSRLERRRRAAARRRPARRRRARPPARRRTPRTARSMPPARRRGRPRAPPAPGRRRRRRRASAVGRPSSAVAHARRRPARPACPPSAARAASRPVAHRSGHARRARPAVAPRRRRSSTSGAVAVVDPRHPRRQRAGDLVVDRVAGAARPPRR